jgi:hypothetical protein
MAVSQSFADSANFPSQKFGGLVSDVVEYFIRYGHL